MKRLAGILGLAALMVVTMATVFPGKPVDFDAAGVTGTLAVGHGGTGLTSYAVGDLLTAPTTTTLASVADVAVGSVLTSGGVGVIPAWSNTPLIGGASMSLGATGTAFTLDALATGTTGLLIRSNTAASGGVDVGITLSVVGDLAAGDSAAVVSDGGGALLTVSGNGRINLGSATSGFAGFSPSASIVSLVKGDGTAGGSLRISAGDLTAGTMTAEKTSEVRTVTTSYTWTNAMVTALGATTSGDITIATLPAKTEVVDCYMVVSTAETALTSLTGAVGRTGATYIDYTVASNLKAAANTVYGNDSAERGTNLTGYDMPSYTGTTGVKLHLVSGVENLSTAVACTGRVVLVTRLVP